MKMFIWILVIVLVLLIGFLAWAGHPWSLSPKKFRSEVIHIEPQGMVDNEEHPSVIKVLTWNLSYLYGQGSQGLGYVTKDKAYFEERLNELVKEIHEWRADVVCLQEVDFDSARSGHINQARYLAEKANYPYVAEAVSWQANYIPYPYWPVAHHFGAMKSGGAIISKYPILDQEVFLLEKPMSRPWWYNIFYLHRFFQRVTIEFGDKKLQFVNLHVESFDKKNRMKQVKELTKLIQKEKVDVITGDFNTVPTSASKKSNFSNKIDDYENDNSYELMMKTGLSEVFPEEIYSQDESRYFTFPSWKPDRRLDYIFFRPELKMMKAEILPSALSDHLPLRASFQIGNPDFSPYSQ